MNEIFEHDATLDLAALAAGAPEDHPPDIVEGLNAEPLEAASAVLAALPLERAAEVFDEPGLERAEELIEVQPQERAVALLKAMSADRAADVFRHLEPHARDRLLAELDGETRTSLIELLAYPENTAGSNINTQFVIVPSTWTVGETLQHIRQVHRPSSTD